jgi:hypothetical protein
MKKQSIAFVVDIYPSRIDVSWKGLSGETITLSYSPSMLPRLQEAMYNEDIARLIELWDEEN